MRKKQKNPICLCTYARGGMRTVVEGYNADGLSSNWNMNYLWTHIEGNFIKKQLFSICAWFKYLFLLIKGNVSFVHIHSAMRGSFWRKTVFSKTAHIFGVPTIMHLHGSEMETFYKSLNGWGKKLVQWSLETTDVVIVLSESWRIFVQKIAPSAKIVVINNYVTPPQKSEYLPQENRFNVLFLGVLGQRKGIYDLVSAWSEVVSKYPHAKLIIGGNGEIEQVKKLIIDLGLHDSIDLLGWVGGNDKLKLLADTDVFVLPSYNEGLPMSVLEAMAWQRAVVTTKVGGIPELICNKVDGLLIDPGNVSALLESLLDLAGNPSLRISLADNARQKILMNFSNEVVIPQIEKVYLELTER